MEMDNPGSFDHPPPSSLFPHSFTFKHSVRSKFIAPQVENSVWSQLIDLISGYIIR